MSQRKEPVIPNELLDQLLAGGAANSAFDHGGLLDSLKAALIERALNAEMDHHLGGDVGAGKPPRDRSLSMGEFADWRAICGATKYAKPCDLSLDARVAAVGGLNPPSGFTGNRGTSGPM